MALSRTEAPEQFQPRKARHFMIGDQHIKFARPESNPTRLAIRGNTDPMPGVAQYLGDGIANSRIIINHENATDPGRGNGRFGQGGRDGFTRDRMPPVR